MKTLLIDDEPLARAELRRLLRRHPDIEIVGEAGDADEARELLRTHAPELLLLDVQMPEETGFDLLASLAGRVPPVIFTTAFDEYAVRAFEFGALDYIVKPVEPERLAAALARVGQRPGPTEGSTTGLPPPRLGPEEKILIRDSDRCWFVPVSQLRGVESDGDHVRLWLPDVSPTLHRSIAQLEERLPTDLFFRANRSQLINLRNVEHVEPWFSGTLRLTLTGGRTVELSRRQAQTFRDQLSL